VVVVVVVAVVVLRPGRFSYQFPKAALHYCLHLRHLLHQFPLLLRRSDRNDTL
jgi:hypothetical protein